MTSPITLPNHVIEQATLDLFVSCASSADCSTDSSAYASESNRVMAFSTQFHPNNIILALSKPRCGCNIRLINALLDHCHSVETRDVTHLFNSWQWEGLYPSELFVLAARHFPLEVLEKLATILESHGEIEFRGDRVLEWMLRRQCGMAHVMHVLRRFRGRIGVAGLGVTSRASTPASRVSSVPVSTPRIVEITAEALEYFFWEEHFDFFISPGKLRADFLLLDELFFTRQFTLPNAHETQHDRRIKWNRSLLRYWEFLLDDVLWREYAAQAACTGASGKNPLTEDDRKRRLIQCAKSRDAYDQTLLHVVCSRGILTPIVKYLVEQVRMSPNTEDHEGYTPLHCAVTSTDSYDLLKYLLFKGAKAKNTKDGFSPLMAACANGNEKAIFFLGNNQINHASESTGTSALHVAAEMGQLSALKKLLGSKSKRSVKDVEGHTALTLALVNGHDECACELIRAKCKLDIALPAHHASVSMLKYVWMFLRSEAVVRCLIESIDDAQTFVKLLVGEALSEGGMKVDQPESECGSALTMVMHSYLLGSWSEMKKVLLGAQTFHDTDKNNTAPKYTTLNLLDELWVHVMTLDVGAVKCFVELQAERINDNHIYNLSPQDVLCNSNTVLMQSILDNNLEAVQLCFKKHAQVNCHIDDISALFLVLESASQDIVSLVLKHPDLDFAWCDSQGNNALHVVCDAIALNGRPLQLLRELVNRCPYAANAHGETPLILAAMSGSLEVAQVLLDAFYPTAETDAVTEMTGTEEQQGEDEEPPTFQIPMSARSQHPQWEHQIDHMDIDGKSALYYAVFHLHTPLISTLLSEPYNAQVTGEMLFLACIVHNNASLVEMLFPHCTPKILEDVMLCDKKFSSCPDGTHVRFGASIDEPLTPVEERDSHQVSISAWNTDVSQEEKPCAPISQAYFQMLRTVASERSPDVGRKLIALIVEFYACWNIQQRQDALWDVLQDPKQVLQDYVKLRKLMDAHGLGFAPCLLAANYVHEHDNTFLHHCAKDNLVQVGKLLLRLGSDTSNAEDVLLVACQHDSLEFYLWFSEVTATVEFNADMLFEILQKGSKRILQHVRQHESPERLKNIIDYTHLSAAAMRGDADTCRILYNEILDESYRPLFVDKLLEYARGQVCLKEIINTTNMELTWQDLSARRSVLFGEALVT